MRTQDELRHGSEQQTIFVNMKNVVGRVTKYSARTLLLGVLSPGSEQLKLLAHPRKSLDLPPKFGARIVGIEPRQFAQQFFGLFITRHRHGNFDFHNFIAA